MKERQSLAQNASLNLKNKFDYSWNMKDGYPKKGIPYHGTKVMTTFACGGGSSMGYKLAGYDVVAANDIDKKMADVYKKNHNPKQFFECGVEELIERDDLPEVDVLDGSPPCSVFSMTGKREKYWQKEKKFKEGQAEQVLDDLFFKFIALAEKMQPKVVIAENVKGMLFGNAKGYTRQVINDLEALGYTVQVFSLNGAHMGLPQKRERVFFIGHHSENRLDLSFNEKLVRYKDIREDDGTKLRGVTELFLKYWNEAKPGDSIGKFDSLKKAHPFKVPNTIPASIGACPMDSREPRYLYREEIEKIGSWPHDYDYNGIQPQYLIGMSVPPLMMANVSLQVYNQIISEKAVRENA